MTILHGTDAYKLDHRSQYPKGTELVFSNWTARKSRMPGVDKVIFFGLQAYMMEYLVERWNKDFFKRDLEEVVMEYMTRIEGAGIKITYDHIVKLHQLGYLPIEIWALPEGTAVPIGVPMFVMWNTHPDFFWVTNYLETSLSANLWGPCTSATIAQQYRQLFADAFSYTGISDPNFIDFQGHDFSYRGMYGNEAAALSGAGHLLSFNGTDSIPALDFLAKYYNAGDEFIGGSVPATEHSVMCMGSKESEIETFRRLITDVYPTGIVSIVSDTWNYWKVWTEILPQLKDVIMRREGTVVIRPDSGDPVKIICGDPDAPAGTPAHKGSFNLAWDLFGGTLTHSLYRELDSHIGLIYGDSITLDRARAICTNLRTQGFVPKIVLGIGSYTYQMVTRDTFGFALKSTAGVVNGEVREIFKDPVTDDGTKKSAKGFTAVYETDEGLVLRDQVSLNAVRTCAFIKVFQDGVVHPRCNLGRMRKVVRG